MAAQTMCNATPTPAACSPPHPFSGPPSARGPRGHHPNTLQALSAPTLLQALPLSSSLTEIPSLRQRLTPWSLLSERLLARQNGPPCHHYQSSHPDVLRPWGQCCLYLRVSTTLKVWGNDIFVWAAPQHRRGSDQVITEL